MLIIKVTLGHDTRRFSVDKNPTFQQLTDYFEKIFGPNGNSFDVKYTDPDGDVITVASDIELQEAIGLASNTTGNHKMLRLTLNPRIPYSAASLVASQSFNPHTSQLATSSGHPALALSGSHLSPAPVTLPKIDYPNIDAPYHGPGGASAPPTTSSATMNKLADMLTEVAIARHGADHIPEDIAASVRLLKSYAAEASPTTTNNTTPSSPGTPISSSSNSSGISSAIQSQIQAKIASMTQLPAYFNKPATVASSGVAAPSAEVPPPQAAPVLPSQPVPEYNVHSDAQVHVGIICDGCQSNPLTGPRRSCTLCPDFDLCERCFMRGVHRDTGHAFMIHYSPVQPQLPQQQQPSAYVPKEKLPPIVAIPSPVGASSIHFHALSPSTSIASSSVLGNDEHKYAGKFEEDVTLSDGTEVIPSAKLHKIWRLGNDGPRPWPEGTVLSFVGGDKLTDVSQVPIGKEVQTGESVEVSVDVRAPARNGRYISYWRLCAPDGTRFGHRVWIDIIVNDECYPHSTSIPVASAPVVLPAPTVEVAAPVPIVPAPVDAAVPNIASTTVVEAPPLSSSFGLPKPEEHPVVPEPQSAAPEPAPDAQQPTEPFADGIKALHDMGFFEDESNRSLLKKHNGDLTFVVQDILSGIKE